MSQTVIGLDIGRYSVKALKLQVSYRGFEAVSYDEEILDTVIAMPAIEALTSGIGEGTEVTEEVLADAIHDAEDEALSNALAALAERGALDGETIAVAFPPDLVLSSRMRFPFTDPRQLSMVIPSEFEETVPVDLEDLMLGHHLIGPSAGLEEGNNDVMVTAIKREDLEIFLELWDESGVDPHYVVMGDAAMAHLAAYLLEELTEPYAIVDIGHRFTRVVCIEPDHSGDEVAFRLGYARTFQFGGHDITMALKDSLGSTYPDAEHYKHKEGFIALDTLVMGLDGVKSSDAIKKTVRGAIRELRRTFQAHYDERRTPVQNIFICGGTSRLRNLGPFLAEELGIPVEPLPVAGEELSGLDIKGAEAMSAAQTLALALKDVVQGNAAVDINFRTGAYAHKGAQGWFREKLPGLIVLGALFLLALITMFATDFYSIGKEEEALKATVEQASASLFGEILSPEDISKKLVGNGDGKSLIPQNSAYDYFTEVEKRTPEGTSIEFVDLEVDLFRQIIKVRATTTEASIVDTYVESLEGNECFKGKIQKGGTESVGDRVRFDLTIAPECPGAQKDKK